MELRMDGACERELLGPVCQNLSEKMASLALLVPPIDNRACAACRCSQLHPPACVSTVFWTAGVNSWAQPKWHAVLEPWNHTERCVMVLGLEPSCVGLAARSYPARIEPKFQPFPCVSQKHLAPLSPPD